VDDVKRIICQALCQGGGWYRTATVTAGQSWGAACAKCAKGTATDLPDATSCDPCGAGGYADVTGLEQCKACPAGTAVVGDNQIFARQVFNTHVYPRVLCQMTSYDAGIIICQALRRGIQRQRHARRLRQLRHRAHQRRPI